MSGDLSLPGGLRVPENSAVWIDLMPIIMAALPLAHELVGLVIDAVQSARGGDVTPGQIDGMMLRIKQKNEEIQVLVAAIEAERSGSSASDTPGS